MTRQIVLDTETTGLEPSEGHRIIEIGCVELLERRQTGNNFQQYLNPEREIEAGAVNVHGITDDFLADKPRFADIAEGFLNYIEGAELVIHNAPFDLGFLNHELERLGGGRGRIQDCCQVIDTLDMARRMHPGQRNGLDALCRRYEIDNSHRKLHGALLDSEILADVYLAMTGGQVSLSLDHASEAGSRGSIGEIRRLAAGRGRLRIIPANALEMERHRERLMAIDKASGGDCLWLAEEKNPA
ncbi:MAG: DNA polymerase III subunit epsilon [Gammaproteobacteria bacterium]|nr:DNA polymerase III subunit epsilon [Gammaproteobacteria bacterium]MBU1655655.1 DNA polymerase III subunit epsilon [Gammaproteobacteria bacterium]MBU1960308.1 DNA polymerase III subunit epsilon [Gammaproteobacteria bacterium]